MSKINGNTHHIPVISASIIWYLLQHIGGKVIYHELKHDVGQILRKLCHERKEEMIEAEACPDHIDMLVNIPVYMGIAQFVGLLKNKSALMRQFEIQVWQ